MTTILLAFYLKLNLLLVLAAALWLTSRAIGLLKPVALDARQQLALARGLLIGALLLTLAPLVVDLLQPGWLARWSKTLAGSYSDTYTVVAGAASTLTLLTPKGTQGLNIRQLLGLLLLSGLVVQGIRVGWQWLHLRTLIKAATPWKRIAGVHLLLSADAGSPFTTRALGVRHIVLPVAMLDSPFNLKLALKHELQHLRQHDLEWLLALELLKVFCWWNPLAHWWHREYDLLHELACDEALVLERRVDSKTYGNCLLDVADGATTPSLFATSTMVPKASWFSFSHSQLRRRIMKLLAMKKDRHSRVKGVVYALLLGSGLLGGTLVVLAADAPVPRVGKFGDVIPRVRINPEYPQRMLARGQEGWVELQFDITVEGKVENAVAIKGSPNAFEGSEIPGQLNFALSALRAIEKWQYEPAIENDRPVRRDGIHTMLRFQLEPNEPKPQ